MHIVCNNSNNNKRKQLQHTINYSQLKKKKQQ